MRAKRVAEREGVTVAQARAENDERQGVERARYLALYGLDLEDLSIYDVLLDSGALGPAELADRIVETALKLLIVLSDLTVPWSPAEV